MPAQTIIKLRRGTATQWTTANPVLAAGEIGLETNTNRTKYGDGTTTWSALPYSVADASGTSSVDWAAILNKPTTFAPSAHTHSIDDITDYEPPAGTIVSDTAPTGVDAGTIWYDSTSGVAYIYYDSFWVQLAPGVPGPQGPEGPAGPTGATGDAAFHPFLTSF